MIKTEFGIIDDPEKFDGEYNPRKYHCVFIDDELYIDDWWEKLMLMKTYFNTLDEPEFGLARYGITLIPPQSLHILLETVLADKRLKKDNRLAALAEKINKAIRQNKYMIH